MAHANNLRHLPARAALAVAMMIGAAAAAADGDRPFDTTVLSVPDRTVTAELVELNGDGRTDLLLVVVARLPPAETRTVRVYHQGEDHLIPPLPSFEIPLPENAGAYDLADVRDAPGTELILARAADLTILSLSGREAERWVVPLPAPGSVWPGNDDRGLERVSLRCGGCGGDATFLVPQFGHLAVLSADGAVIAQLDTGGRVNYLVPAERSVLFSESELQVFYDVPRLSLVDVDGDAATDVVSATRHEVRVFRNPGGGRFARAATQRYPLHAMTERDHVRGTGGVSVQAADVDGDGRADLFVSHLSGGLTNARLAAQLHRNRDGEWNIATPDSSLAADAALGSDTLIDFDGDGRLEVLRLVMSFSVLELVEALVTRSIDAQFSIYRLTERNVLSAAPSERLQVDIPINFDTFRARGFLPVWHLDFNRDGHRDLIRSGGGEAVEISLGGRGHAFDRNDARQEADTHGVLHSGDLDGNDLPDFVVFDPLTDGATVRVFRNRGVLPGAGDAAPSPPAQ